MIIKEEDAKHILCPIISTAEEVTGCGASRCMAWVWDAKGKGHCALIPSEKATKATKEKKDAE